MEIITVRRTICPRNFIVVSSGVLCTDAPDTKLDCNELCRVKDRKEDLIVEKGEAGGTVNYFGDLIGMLFYDSAFMPINIVLRWWNHFKSCSCHCSALEATLSHSKPQHSYQIQFHMAMFEKTEEADESTREWTRGARPASLGVRVFWISENVRVFLLEADESTRSESTRKRRPSLPGMGFSDFFILLTF